MSVQSVFIEKMKRIVAEKPANGLFPSVTIAQAALESGYGTSGLTAKYNNAFGIKANSAWKGKSSVMKTGEVLGGKSVTVNAGFRVYDSLADSVADRNNFLKVNTRYTRFGVFAAKTPEDQARALQAAGYATDPKYADKIIKIIYDFHLKEIDKVVAEVTSKKKSALPSL